MSNDDELNKNLLPASREEQKPSWTLLQVEDNPANSSLVEELILRRSDLKMNNPAATSGVSQNSAS